MTNSNKLIQTQQASNRRSGKFVSKDNKCIIDGSYVATVIYKDADNQTGMIQKSVEFDYAHKTKNASERLVCFGSVTLSGCSCSVTGDSRIEMKTEINASVLVFSSAIRKYISSIDILNENNKKEDSCALTVYFCDKGENVWNIAKKYNTTVDAVMHENDLKSDIIENAAMILIPRV